VPKELATTCFGKQPNLIGLGLLPLDFHSRRPDRHACYRNPAPLSGIVEKCAHGGGGYMAFDDHAVSKGCMATCQIVWHPARAADGYQIWTL
jgi:hypothetical protein